MALRLGLVGRGRWGRIIERTLLTFPDVSVVPIGRGVSPPAGLEGALIATPSATHADVALPYIECGLATFIEKPMATTVADAERLRQAAARSGAAVFVGHIFLYNPAFAELLKILPGLGAVRQVTCDGMNDQPRTDSSLLWDWLPHDLSTARAIFGSEPFSVETWSLSGSAAPSPVSKFMFGGIPLISIMSWLSPVRRKHMTVACEKGIVVFDDKAERRLAVHDASGEVSHPPYDKEPPLARELRMFLEMIRTGRRDMPHIEVGAGIVGMIAAAERSLASGGQPVAIHP